MESGLIKKSYGLPSHPIDGQPADNALQDVLLKEYVAALWSEIIHVWGLGGPGAPKTLPKGGGRSPPPFGRAPGAPGADQTTKMADFRSATNWKLPPEVQPRVNQATHL